MQVSTTSTIESSAPTRETERLRCLLHESLTQLLNSAEDCRGVAFDKVKSSLVGAVTNLRNVTNNVLLGMVFSPRALYVCHRRQIRERGVRNGFMAIRMRVVMDSGVQVSGPLSVYVAPTWTSSNAGYSSARLTFEMQMIIAQLQF